MHSCVIITSGSNSALVVYWIQSFSPVRELRADQVLSLGSLVTEMAERELQAAAPTDLGALAHLGTLSNWSPKKVFSPLTVSSWYWTKQVNRAATIHFMLPSSIFSQDESSDFRCNVETQTRGGAVCGNWFGDIRPPDLWAASLRDQKTEPKQPEVRCLSPFEFLLHKHNKCTKVNPKVLFPIFILGACFEGPMQKLCCHYCVFKW